MSLNIKNERVHALAREAAHVLRTSQTSAIEEALVQLLARHRAATSPDLADRAQRVAAILADFDERLTDDDRAAMRRHEDLYDDLGLPA